MNWICQAEPEQSSKISVTQVLKAGRHQKHHKLSLKNLDYNLNRIAQQQPQNHRYSVPECHPPLNAHQFAQFQNPYNSYTVITAPCQFNGPPGRTHFNNEAINIQPSFLSVPGSHSGSMFYLPLTSVRSPQGSQNGNRFILPAQSNSTCKKLDAPTINKVGLATVVKIHPNLTPRGTAVPQSYYNSASQQRAESNIRQTVIHNKEIRQQYFPDTVAARNYNEQSKYDYKSGFPASNRNSHSPDPRFRRPESKPHFAKTNSRNGLSPYKQPVTDPRASLKVMVSSVEQITRVNQQNQNLGTKSIQRKQLATERTCSLARIVDQPSLRIKKTFSISSSLLQPDDITKSSANKVNSFLTAEALSIEECLDESEHQRQSEQDKNKQHQKKVLDPYRKSMQTEKRLDDLRPKSIRSSGSEGDCSVHSDVSEVIEIVKLGTFSTLKTDSQPGSKTSQQI